ncbi:GNAT family N-acetyltransferase [Mycetocola zhujimingii]|uniref:GNAT family N-acetyltransferase n=1 Tax=Mycetocola zhujimingii TaxID=2079792 RepID=UPI000D352718|nr:N-acetyltransferase [Mycetocola zhujimingii]AWB85669.1 hypothetical protein C3E77_02875 [Mycetocola zhujimingii]
MLSTSIRALQIDDIPAVVRLLRTSFEPHLWPLMTYTQSGVARYLAAPLRFPGATPSTTSLVLVGGEGEQQAGVIGFADFRIVDTAHAHLSYICVAEEARGNGFASLLIREFVRMHPEVTTMSLDVFRDNGAARSLYTRLGFRDSGSSVWITRQLPEARGVVAVDNLPFALAAHSAYGFCELNVRRSVGGRRYGLLGDATVRTFSAEDFDEDEPLAALHAMFAGMTTALYVAPEDELALIKSDFEVVKTNNRMSLSWQVVTPPPWLGPV